MPDDHAGADAAVLPRRLRRSSLCIVPTVVRAAVVLFGLSNGRLVGAATEPGRSSSTISSICAAYGWDSDRVIGCASINASAAGHDLAVFAYPLAETVATLQWVQASQCSDPLVQTVTGVVANAISISTYGLAGGDVSLGKWHGVRRMVNSPKGTEYADAAAAEDADSRWQELCERDKRYCDELARELRQVKTSCPEVHELADHVTGISDFAADLPVPLQGPPDYSDPALADYVIMKRPPPPSTHMLHTIPPQRDVFGANKPVHWASHGSVVGVLTYDGGCVALAHLRKERDWVFDQINGGAM